MRLCPFYVCLSPPHFGRSKDEKEMWQERAKKELEREMKPENSKVHSASICSLEVSVVITVV